MGNALYRWRRDGRALKAAPAPTAPLLALLDLTAGNANRGYALRFGRLTITAADMLRIALAIGVADLI